MRRRDWLAADAIALLVWAPNLAAVVCAAADVNAYVVLALTASGLTLILSAVVSLVMGIQHGTTTDAERPCPASDSISKPAGGGTDG